MKCKLQNKGAQTIDQMNAWDLRWAQFNLELMEKRVKKMSATNWGAFEMRWIKRSAFLNSVY